MSRNVRAFYELLAFSAVFAAVPFAVHAADISFGGASSATIGATIAIPVLVNSPEVAINAVSLDIQYPSDVLTLTSIVKGPLVNFWTNEPSFSQAGGTATIEGVIFNPGWTGTAGRVVTLNFTPKKVGSATIIFSRGSVLANDGQGTELIENKGSKTLAIAAPAPKLAQKPEPLAEAKPPEQTVATTSATSTQPVPPSPPTISSYTHVVDKDHPFLVSGKTVPGAQVDVLLSGCDGGLAFSGLSAASDCAEATSRSVVADENGFFVLLWTGDLPQGSYSFIVRATDKGLASQPTVPATVIVQGGVQRTLALLFLDNLALLFAVVLAAAGFLALGLGLFYGVRVLWRAVIRAKAAPYAMEISRGDAQIDGYLKVLERAAGKRELTEEEHELYTAMKSGRAHPEEPLVTRLTWVKKD